MAKPNTTASDILSLKNVRPTIQRMILEEQWKVRIAKAIHERRDKAGLSIKEVARRASVPVSTVQRLEDADPRWVSLAQFFNLTVSAAHSVSRQDLFARVRVIVSFELKIPHIIP